MKKIILTTIFSFLLIPAVGVMAADPPATASTEGQTDSNYKDISIQLNVPVGTVTGGQVRGSLLGEYFKAWYNLLLGAVGIIATIIIMWGGFKWLSSRGDPKQISDAQDTIFSAIAGLVLAFGSYLIISLINPSLTEINMPEIENITVTSNYDVMSQEYSQSVGSYEHEGRTGSATPVNLTGATAETQAIIGAVTSATGASPTSVFRPHDIGSRHARGTAADFPRNDQTNQYFGNIIANETPDFWYNGQPGYVLNDVNIGGTVYPTIRVINEYKPGNNCWHIDQG